MGLLVITGFMSIFEYILVGIAGSYLPFQSITDYLS